MPELPEVETVRRGLAPALVGARFDRVEQRRADLRFPLPERFAARLEGAAVTALGRRAKYLLATLDSGDTLVMHLGMTGRFTVEPAGGAAAHRPGEFVHEAGTAPNHEHLVFHMSNGATVRYADARRFGYMLLVPTDGLGAHPHLRQLGAEPLGDALDPAYLAGAAAGRRTDLKAFLMDQRVIAGLGNIYVCEALHRARLSPRRGAASLATGAGAPSIRALRLVPAIKETLADAVRAGGSTLRDYQTTDGSLGDFQHSFAVYGRAGLSCLRPGCGGTIRRLVQGGRSTFFCPRCQR
jgi:formamidopyrimidine-DNA glycosylase